MTNQFEYLWICFICCSSNLLQMVLEVSWKVLEFDLGKGVWTLCSFSRKHTDSERDNGGDWYTVRRERVWCAVNNARHWSGHRVVCVSLLKYSGTKRHNIYTWRTVNFLRDIIITWRDTVKMFLLKAFHKVLSNSISHWILAVFILLASWLIAGSFLRTTDTSS